MDQLKKGICLLVACFSMMSSPGQHPAATETGYPFLKNYTPRDYRAHTQNFAIVRDQFGMMYFGNFSGILQFDGTTWRLIETEKTSRVTALAIDSNGTIYAGARGELGLIQPDSIGKMVFHSLLPETMKDYTFREIDDIYCTPEGVYFISDKILFLYRNGKMESWKPQGDIISGYYVRGNLYLQIRGTGLTLYADGRLQTIPRGTEFTEAIEIKAMLPYTGDQILIATGTQGLYALDPVAGVNDIYTRADQLFEKNLITDAVQLPDNTYAFGTSREGIIITGPDGTVIQILNRNCGLANDYVNNLWFDERNTLWAALNNGIAAVDIPAPFTIFDEQKGLDGGISDIIRWKGNLVVSTYEGVYFWDREKERFLPVQGIITAGWSLAESGDDLFAATSQGLFRIDPPRATLLMEGFCMALACSGKDPGTLYLGRTDGLYRLTRSGKGWKPTKIESLDDEVRWLVFDKYDILWGSMISGRILRLGENDHVVFMDTTSGLPEQTGLMLNLIENNIVAASRYGVHVYDKPTGRFRKTSPILRGDTTSEHWYSLLFEDRNKNLWVTSGDNKDLTFFRWFQGGYEMITDPFLPIANVAITVILPEQDSITWLGGPDGLIRYDAAIADANKEIPPVLIRQVMVKTDSMIYGGNPRSHAKTRPGSQIYLPYSDNTIYFEYSAPYFSSRGEIIYSHKLDGFDETWSEWSSQDHKEYTNLPEGKYTFHVRAKNIYGRISEEATFPFTIRAPWYKKWYAYIFYVLAAGGLVWFILIIRNRQLIKEKQVLEQTISDRTAEVVQQKEEIEKQSTELAFKNEELEKINRVVKAINSEIHFQNLLQSLLEKTRMIRAVENSTALVFDRELNLFQFRASFGWNIKKMEMVRMTLEQTENRYLKGSEEIYEDIFLKRDYSSLSGIPELEEMELPRSMLILVIRVDNRVEAFLILENMTRDEAFTEQDLSLIRNAKEHIISAFIKTRILADLQSTVNNLKETQDQLIQSEKLASLGQLTAGIAHEIQNPLNFVNNFSALSVELSDELKGYAEELKDLIKPEMTENILEVVEMIRGNVQKINEHGKRAASIVKGMLQHSRGKSGEFEPTDINNLVTEYVNLAYHGMRAKDKSFNTALKTNLDPAVGKAVVVPQDISRVILNIVNNACYAVDEKTKKGISGYAPEVLTSTRKRGDKIEIRIRDNGTGMPQHVIEKIFNPFFTTKPTGKGTGLGLSMSFDIITQIHKGKLEVQSKEGEYTEFIITIPEQHQA